MEDSLKIDTNEERNDISIDEEDTIEEERSVMSNEDTIVEFSQV